MRLHPSQPHFFKFIRPNSQHTLSIPESFRKKHLEGLNWGKAVLRRGRGKWVVRINKDWVFGKGWVEFLRENGVQDCDFVVFKHEGDMVFEVMVFGDSSTCEIKYPHPDDQQSCSDSTHFIKEEPYSGPIFQGPTETMMEAKENIMSRLKGKTKALSEADHRPYFKSILTRYGFKRSELYIPSKFAKAYGLNDRKCEVILVDEKQRSWSAKVKQKKSSHTCLFGWRKLRKAIDIKEGDTYMLELIQQGDKPIMNFHHLRNEGKIMMPKKEIIVDDSHSYFTSIVKMYNMKYSFLNLPNKFSRNNDLRDGKMILRNEKQQSWTVELRDVSKFVRIAKGWDEFKIDNNIKEGDAYRFLLIQNGSIPIAEFHL